MSQSIKLNDNNFVDATGVWDSTIGKTQRDFNKSETISVTLHSSISADFLYAKKSGNVTTVSIRILSCSVPYGTAILTLPVGARPSANILFTGQSAIVGGTTYENATFLLGPNGELKNETLQATLTSANIFVTFVNGE